MDWPTAFFLSVIVICGSTTGVLWWVARVFKHAADAIEAQQAISAAKPGAIDPGVGADEVAN